MLDEQSTVGIGTNKVAHRVVDAGRRVTTPGFIDGRPEKLLGGVIMIPSSFSAIAFTL